MTEQSHIDYLRQCFPRLEHFFDAVQPVTYPLADQVPLSDAFVRVVNSQMLSTKAAAAILGRVREIAEEKHYANLNQLTFDEFRHCGMSRGKIRSIQEFTDRYTANPAELEGWRKLSYDDLCIEVDKIWGVSTWTAQMLAMFYFGHQDVFPIKDLAIHKGTELIKAYMDPDFDPEQAAPYRTLLARCLWRSFDVDYWKEFP